MFMYVYFSAAILILLNILLIFFHLVCDNMDNYSSASPFLCMDLSYITALLKEGFGFGDTTVLQASKNSRIQPSISSHLKILIEISHQSPYLSIQ